jgi:protein-S-isoprenylcysteine O-methyltransferase Ste14
MAGEHWARGVAKLARKERSPLFQFGALLLGATVFLVLFPALVIWIAKLLTGWIPFSLPRGIEGLVSAFCLGYGLFWVFWSSWTQWTRGRGTPAPIAPTSKLVITGPYRYCRNPIQLGAMFYQAGLGILFGTIVTGIAVFILVGIAGTLYHKLVEEKELTERFGEEYEEYKAEVPFLIPRRRREG